MMRKWSSKKATLVFLACCLCRAAANDGEVRAGGLVENDSSGESAYLEAQASRNAGGSVNTFHNSFSQSSSGGQIFFAKSGNWNPIRAHASKTVLFPRQSSHINSRKSIDIVSDSKLVQNEVSRNDLHYAFRLPLQRLSDKQLTILLERYQSRHKTIDAPDYRTMSKAEKVRRLQKMIITRSGPSGGRLQLIRPTLLTNINVINEDDRSSFSIKQENDDNNRNIQEVTNQSTTVKFMEERHKIDTESNISSLIDDKLDSELEILHRNTNSVNISSLSRLLNELKTRYEKIKQIFKAKLEELNEKRKSLFTKLSSQQERRTSDDFDSEQTTTDFDFTTTTTTTTTTTSAALSTSSPIETTQHVIKTSNGSNEPTLAVEELHSLIKFPSLKQFGQQIVLDSSLENDADRGTYPSEPITTRFRLTTTTTMATIEPTTTTESTMVTVEPIITTESTTTTETTSTELQYQSRESLENIQTVHTFVPKLSDNEKSTTMSAEHMDSVTEQSRNASIEASSGDDSFSNGGNKLIKKILGLIQFVKNNKTKPTSVLSNETHSQFSTSKLFKSYSTDEDLQSAASISEVKAPRAKQIPSQLPLISNGGSEENEMPTLKQNIGDISTMELMKTLQTENELLQRQNELDNEANAPRLIDPDFDVQSVKMCSAINCDFEQGALCLWSASEDTIMPGDRQYRKRVRRVRNAEKGDKRDFVQRTWHNWEGRYRNHLTGIARAEVFSKMNRRFAASYVKPNQRATLSADMPFGNKYTIKFRAWEATRDVRLRLCCISDGNEQCVFETERGVRRGSRHWKEHTAECPLGTSKMIFECVNDGLYQGACGLDNIQLQNERCPDFVNSNGIIENRLRRH